MAAVNETQRPRVLVSNDDGIQAPGLQALVARLVAANFCDVYVSAPAAERSAQSHAITLGRYLSCYRYDVPGTVESYAVEGTPADSVMLALNGPMFKNSSWDLVVSGINRGNNMGSHVIYSGTVGAAREAACKGLPGIAFSLDDHQARSTASYDSSSALSVVLIQSVLGLVPPCPCVLSVLQRCVLNVNFPNKPLEEVRGYRLAHQTFINTIPYYEEVIEKAGPHMPEIDEHTPDVRVFRNYAGCQVKDDTADGDDSVVAEGWVSVTPLSLRSDLTELQAGMQSWSSAVLEATVQVVVAAAAATNKTAVTTLPAGTGQLPLPPLPLPKQ